VLSDAKFRRIGIAATNQPPSPTPAADRPESSPACSSRALKQKAALSLPVESRCVVTLYDDFRVGTMFVQDSTAGIYVDAHDHTLDLELGQWLTGKA